MCYWRWVEYSFASLAVWQACLRPGRVSHGKCALTGSTLLRLRWWKEIWSVLRVDTSSPYQEESPTFYCGRMGKRTSHPKSKERATNEADLHTHTHTHTHAQYMSALQCCEMLLELFNEFL